MPYAGGSVNNNNTHTPTHPFNGPLSGTTRVSQYQKGKTNLDFTEARDSEWRWHQLGHMQVCTLLQTDNHASTPPLSFLQAGCPSCHPTNSVKALKAIINTNSKLNGSWVTTCSRPVIDLSCTPGGNWSLKQHCRCLESMVLGAPGSRRGHAGSLITQCNRSQSARLCRAAAAAGYQFCHHHSTSTVPPRPLSTGGTIYKISYDLS